jgi:hypothetical protein
MATNMTSVDVVAGNDANASEYNTLREDVIVNAGDYETAGGTGNAITLAIDAAISAYAAGQKFRFQASADNTGATTFNVNSIGAKSIVTNQSIPLVGGEILNGQEVEVVYDGTNMQLLSLVAADEPVFGGDGSDGALDTSGGSVNIDLGNADYVVKNYTSMNVASNNLTFTNPSTNGTLIVLKSQGNVTISATIDASGIGASGGAGGSGGDGTLANLILDDSNHQGLTGDSVGGTGPSGGSQYSNRFLYSDSAEKLFRIGIFIAPGSGGGGGSDNNGAFSASGGSGAGATGGAGGAGTRGGSNGGNAAGNSAGGGGGGSDGTGTGSGGDGADGGGAVYIECGGDLNFTGTVDVSGDTASDINDANAGAGGGGAGGMCVILYNTQTSVAGTINSAGGAGGGNTGATPAGTTGGTAGSSNGGLVAQNVSLT